MCFRPFAKFVICFFHENTVVQKYDILLPAKTTYFYDIFSLKYFPIPSLDAWLKCHMPLCIGLCCACVCGVNRPISPSPPLSVVQKSPTPCFLAVLLYKPASAALLETKLISTFIDWEETKYKSTVVFQFQIFSNFYSEDFNFSLFFCKSAEGFSQPNRNRVCKQFYWENFLAFHEIL